MLPANIIGVAGVSWKHLQTCWLQTYRTRLVRGMLVNCNMVLSDIILYWLIRTTAFLWCLNYPTFYMWLSTTSTLWRVLKSFWPPAKTSLHSIVKGAFYYTIVSVPFRYLQFHTLNMVTTQINCIRGWNARQKREPTNYDHRTKTSMDTVST